MHTHNHTEGLFSSELHRQHPHHHATAPEHERESPLFFAKRCTSTAPDLVISQYHGRGIRCHLISSLRDQLSVRLTISLMLRKAGLTLFSSPSYQDSAAVAAISEACGCRRKWAGTPLSLDSVLTNSTQPASSSSSFQNSAAPADATTCGDKSGLHTRLSLSLAPLTARTGPCPLGTHLHTKSWLLQPSMTSSLPCSCDLLIARPPNL